MTRISNQTSRRRVLVTGAGSGTGAASALALAASHDLVLVGRRQGRLDEVAARVESVGTSAQTIAWDVRTDAAGLLARAGTVTDLVLAAGLNTARRAWRDQLSTEFRDVVETNLLAVADIIAAALPQLRAAHGSIAVVSSLSAWTHSPGAGVAYRASKSGLRALTDSLNEQEAEHGVRASLICPGDIDTDFLLQRPSPPGAEPRRSMLSPDDVASAIVFAVNSPRHLRIDELVISPLGTVER